jgi:hypothetical protein
MNFIDDSVLSVDGSLGGLQVLNLTPEGHRHQRVRFFHTITLLVFKLTILYIYF